MKSAAAAVHILPLILPLCALPSLLTGGCCRCRLRGRRSCCCLGSQARGRCYTEGSHHIQRGRAGGHHRRAVAQLWWAGLAGLDRGLLLLLLQGLLLGLLLLLLLLGLLLLRCLSLLMWLLCSSRRRCRRRGRR